MNYEHCMIDVETLGVKNDAVVFQVAVSAFNISGPVPERAASWFISIEDQIDTLHSQIEEGTLMFWTRDNSELWKKLIWEYQSAKVRLSEFNRQFKDFVANYTNSRTQWWAQGTTFDVPKVERLNGGEFCKFWNANDLRTLRAFHKDVQYPPKPTAAHDARADVDYQIECLRRIYVARDAARSAQRELYPLDQQAGVSTK